MKLTKDRILVLLPPAAEPTSPAGILLAHGLQPAVTYGRVLSVGPQVKEVRRLDVVAFSPSAGDPMTVGDHPTMFLRESDIAAIIPKRDTAKESATV